MARLHESLQGDGVKPCVKNPTFNAKGLAAHLNQTTSNTNGNTRSSSHQMFAYVSLTVSPQQAAAAFPFPEIEFADWSSL